MLKVIKIETTKGEIESTLKGVIDENHEEIIADIQEELVNIEQVKNQITKILKRNKMLYLSHLTWLQLIELETSLEFQKHNNEPLKQLEPIDNSVIMLKNAVRTNISPGGYSNKLSSFAKKGTIDGTGFNIFSHELLEMLKISKNSSFDEFIYSLKNTNKTDTLSNKVLSKIAKPYFLKILSNFGKNNALTSNEKEHLSELFVLLACSLDKSSNSGHPSLVKISEYLDVNNLTCGLNHVNVGSGQGYDHLIINIEDNTGFKKLSRFNPIELKWRTSNTRDWLQPCNIERQMNSSFRQSIKILHSLDGLPVGAYKVSKNSDLEFIADTGFSMYTTFGRGNDGITKLNHFDLQLNILAKKWEKNNKGQTFPLHEIVPASGGETLQKLLIDAIREQNFFEGLIENGFILDYTGDLNNYRHVTYLPKRSHIFKFNCYNGIISRTITDRDFMIFDDNNPLLIEPSNVYSSDYSSETIDVDRYYSFILVKDTDFIFSLGLNPEHYRIYITDDDVHERLILTDDNKIVCSEHYYFKHKQDLSAEIKSRFANDVRNGKKLTKWNGIVTDDFIYETDLAFFTANPQPLSRKDNTFRFHPNLNNPRGEAHILGLDEVFYYTFRTGNNSIAAEVQHSEWFQTSYEKFTSRALNVDEPIILEDIFGDADKYDRSYFEGYGEMPSRTFFADGSHNFSKKKIARKLFDENLEIYPQLADPTFDITDLMIKNDVFNEADKLFRGDTRNRFYTTVDETFTVSNESGNKRIDRKNLIRVDWFDTKTFVRRDEVPCYITLIKKFTGDNQSKRLLTLENQSDLHRLKQKGDFLEYVITRNQANYTPSILRKEEDNNTYYMFQIKARNEKSLDIIKNKLLEAPWLNEKGITRILDVHKLWVNRLNKAKVNQKNPSLTITINEFEFGWLLERLGSDINLLFNDLFEIFVSWYNQEEKTTRIQIWNEAIYGKLTRENFYKHMSFGLIPKGSFAGRTRTIYEVNSNEIRNFIQIVYCKYMQMVLYATDNPWLSWARELARVLKSLLIM